MTVLKISKLHGFEWKNHASVTGWQKIFSHTNASNFWRPLQSLRQKILGLPNFNMLFQLVLTKFFKSELFSCLPKVDHVINSGKVKSSQVNLYLNTVKSIRNVKIKNNLTILNKIQNLTTTNLTKTCFS